MHTAMTMAAPGEGSAATRSPSTTISRTGAAGLRRNFGWTLLGNVVFAGSQWGVLVALAKLGTIEMVGAYGFAVAVTGPVFMLANMYLATVLATDPHGEGEFAAYAGTRLTTTVGAVIACLCVALAAHSGRAIIGLVAAVTASKAVESISDITYGLFQRREEMARVGKSLVFRGLLGFCAAAPVIWIASSAVAASIAILVAWTIVLLKFDLGNAVAVLGSTRAIVPRLDRSSIAASIRSGLPLGLVGMLISLTVNVPRYFLEHSQGSRGLGIFVGLAYISTAAVLAINALGASALARLSTMYAKGDLSGFKHLVGRLILFALTVGALELALAIFVGGPFLRVLYTAEYSAHTDAFLILMLAAAIGHVASFLGYATSSTRTFAIQLPLWILIVASVAGISALLIPSRGILGAAWALLGGAIVQLASYGWVYWRLVSRSAAHG